MGPIVDRTREHLGSIDRAIFTARRLLLQAVKTVEAGGDPPGVRPSYFHVRAIEEIVPADVHWSERMREKIFPRVESASP
jgi:hypothetical protein